MHLFRHRVFDAEVEYPVEIEIVDVNNIKLKQGFEVNEPVRGRTT